METVETPQVPTAYYVTKMKESLSLKQRQNPYYSLRAFSRDIGLNSSTVAQILKGKRGLPFKASSSVATKLGLSPKERTLFLESLYKTRTTIDDIKIDDLDDRFMLDESYYKVIAEWEHYAVLTLFEIDGFNSSTSEIASRLNIKENRAEVVLNNLINCGLLIRNNQGKLLPTQSKWRTTEDVSSAALKESHLEVLEIGKTKLTEVEVELRDFSSIIFSMNVDRLPELKTIIREFRKKVFALVKEGKKTDVFQMNIQLYPVTKTKNGETV